MCDEVRVMSCTTKTLPVSRAAYKRGHTEMDGIGLSDCKRSVDNVLVLNDIKLCPKNLTCFRARQSPQFHRAFIVTAKIN